MTRSFLSLLTVLALASLASSAHAQVLTSTRIALRDGVELQADVWTAIGAVTPRPTLLRRTPYGRVMAIDTVVGVVANGYNLVSVDVRGRGDSGGAFLPFVNDGEDGYDTIEWVAAQPWSNERIGTFGGSAEGIVQLLAAGEQPPHLDCALVQVATSDVHAAFYLGGAWRTELGTAWMTSLDEPEALAATRSHEARDAFWEGAILDDAELARVNVPILHVGGAFDIFSVGTTRTFASMASKGMSGSDQFLVFGPWTHGGLTTAVQGEVTFPADAIYTDAVGELIEFFAWCLTDAPQPDWEAARFYVTRLADDGMNATGEWRSSAMWPPSSTRTALFLHDDGTLSRTSPDSEGASAPFLSDPENPIPSLGGGNLTTAPGPFDQQTTDAHAEVIHMQTAPVASDVEIVGDVTATIFASSARTDGDVIVRISDVTPSGRVVQLADGVMRGRFRLGRDAAVAMTPGEPAQFDVDLGSVSFVLPAGHALRIAIQATSSPRFEPNPGSIDPIATATPTATTLTLYRDAAHPSAITLPITAGAFPAPPVEPDAGVSAPDGGTPSETKADDGCGCHVVGARSAQGASLWLAAAVALGVGLRVRRRFRTTRR